MRRIAHQARWKICQSLDVKQTPPPGFRFCNLARKHPAWSPYHKLYVQRFWYQADDARKDSFFTMKIVPFGPSIAFSFCLEGIGSCLRVLIEDPVPANSLESALSSFSPSLLFFTGQKASFQPGGHKPMLSSFSPESPLSAWNPCRMG